MLFLIAKYITMQKVNPNAISMSTNTKCNTKLIPEETDL